MQTRFALITILWYMLHSGQPFPVVDRPVAPDGISVHTEQGDQGLPSSPPLDFPPH